MKIGIKNKFSCDVLNSWSSIHYIENVTNPNQQIIWNNSHTRVADKTIFWKSAFENELIYVDQLFSEDCQILPRAELASRYKLTEMQINTLVSTIPKQWLQQIKNADGDAVFQKILIEKKPGSNSLFYAVNK